MKACFFSVLLFLALVHHGVMAQSQAEEKDVARQTTEAALDQYSDQALNTDKSPLTNLGDEYTNSITLLQNRFRIDFNVQEVTMVFFREYGSSPVVLVRPDGSKLFLGRTEEDKVEWYDSETFDMIKIKNPMPGPWQAVGQVLQDSRVMVLSNLELNVDPLPTPLFAGEILKSTAYLTNNGKPIENKMFRDLVELNIDFKSTNNPNFDNFGAGDESIATFQDNGIGMDERPADGVFTGQFNLKVAPGEWKPVYEVSTPMFTREQEGGLIVLYDNPIDISVELEGGGEGYHKIIIDANRELVDIESLLVDGKVRFPNTDIQNFSLTEGGSEAREHLILSYEPGIFRVKLTAYGTTVNGRDFILDVPEFSFLSEEPADPDLQDPFADSDESMIEDGSSPEIEQEIVGSDMVVSTDEQGAIDSATLTLILVAVNGSIIVIGLAVAAFIIYKRKKANLPPSIKATVQASEPENEGDELTLDMEKAPKGIKKFFAVFRKKGNKT